MGLDINAYRRLERVRDVPRDKDGAVDWDRHDWEREVIVAGFRPFPERSDDLPDGVYTWAEKFRFRAGSYSGYGMWRDWLATGAGYKGGAFAAWKADGGPFWELINFSDCEGWLGAKVSAKLLADFEEYADALAARNSAYDFGKYIEWARALRLAADGGGVMFC